MEILDILTRELERTHQAYLYEEKGHWYAYENSAYLLNHLLQKTTNINVFINTTYEVILAKTEVDFKVLVNCPIISCSDSELIIDCSEVDLPEYKNSNCLDILTN